MPRPIQFPGATIARPRGRPRKTAAPAESTVRFAPIRLSNAIGARTNSMPMSIAFELLFPDGLALRIAPGADPAALERLVVHLRRRVD